MNEYLTLFAIMPKELYKTKSLTSEEKLLAERITALCANKGYAWITNKALAGMYGIREDTVSKHIKKLENYGFIKCKYNNTEINRIKRTIYLTYDVWDKQSCLISSNNQTDIAYTTEYNIKKNIKDNNKDNIYQDIISYDTDGVMLWHGKRCEATPPNEEELKEMEDLLSEFQ